MTVAVALMLFAYAAGNSHCATDRLGRGCGTLRWAAVQIRRKVPTLYAWLTLLQFYPGMRHTAVWKSL